jgi:regulator of replication initiation timing
MTKQEYEKVRQEVAKRYKDRISELERKNALMNKEYVSMLEENHKLKRENAALRNKLNEIPESIRNIMELTNVLGR